MRSANGLFGGGIYSPHRRQLLPPREEELDKWGLGAVTEPSVGVEEKTHPSPSPEERGRK